jgi:hypothetical protein
MADAPEKDNPDGDPHELVARSCELDALDKLLKLRHRLYPSSSRRPDFNPQDWSQDTKHLGNAYQRLKKQRDKLARDQRRAREEGET